VVGLERVHTKLVELLAYPQLMGNGRVLVGIKGAGENFLNHE
jgi:hypothetical protein